MSKISSDDIFESLYNLRMRESAQLKTVLELYDMEIHQKKSVPNYQKVENHGEKEYRSETSATKSGGVVKSRKGLIGVEGGRGICYRWKEKGQCSQGRPMQFPTRNPRSCA